MIVQTIEYNANQPARKQIVVPTNSKYNVGIKVSRNETPLDLDLNEITIDGVSAVSQVAGFDVVGLSSDSVGGLKELDVAISKGPSVNVTIEQTLTGQSTVPFPLNINLDIPLSGYVSGQIEKSWIWLPTATATKGATTGDFWEFSEANSIYIYPQGALKPFGAMLRNKRDQISWGSQLSGDTIDFGENALLRYQWNFASAGTVSVDADWSIIADDGLTASYKLNVQQEDLGYIEA